MTVYKCDRCGNVFESNPAEPIEITMKTNRKITIYIENPVPVNVKSNNDILTVDLCPECLHDYCAFLSDPNTKIFVKGVEKNVEHGIDEPTIKAVPLDKVVLKDIDDEAFEHLIWGRKVRMTHWDKDEYIRLVNEYGDEYLINDKGEVYPVGIIGSSKTGKIYRSEYDKLIQSIEKDKTKVFKEDDEITDIYITVNGEEYHFKIKEENNNE